MKNLFTILLVAFIFSSCGNKENKSLEDVLESGSLSELKEKRQEINSLQSQYQEQLAQLNRRISELDTVQNLPLITTLKVVPQEFNHFLELQGSVDTKQNILIYPETSGNLVRVHVKEGQRVNSGQSLAIIDDSGLSQQLSQLQIQAELAKTTFERQRRLWEQKIGSEIQYLQAKSNYETQMEAINQLKSQLAKFTVRAPFSGVIDDVITEQGTVVAAGQTPLMRLVNLGDMYIETDVPERYITSITEGKNVKVEFPILGKTIDAKVRQAGNFINPANRTFKVEIAIPNTDGDIKPNLTARLKINDYSQENAILIPQSVISENSEGEQYVYIVQDSTVNGEAIAKRIIIKTGKIQGDLIEVIEGIDQTTTIIQEGARSVQDGQKVKILDLNS